MGIVSRSLLALGAVLIIHAGYSAHEHTQLQSAAGGPSPTQAPLTVPQKSGLASLPLDITIEMLISVILLCVAIVGGSEELKPISWRVWAGQIEKRALEGDETEDNESEGFAWLDTGKRKGFIDIRAQRKEFAEWAKSRPGS